MSILNTNMNNGIIAAKVMLIIAFVLLIVYGVDEAVSRASSKGGRESIGFLPLSAMVRGLVFGGSSIVLSVIAFFTAKDISRFVCIMLLINGILITVGGVVASSAFVTALGVLIIALGVIKLFRDAKIAKTI